MNQPVYFAGGYYYPTTKKKDKSGELYTVAITTEPRQFGLVHGCFKDWMPYLTHNPNGLKLTTHHANLYRLSDDMKTAKMVRYTCATVAAFVNGETGPFPESEVHLTADHIEKIKKAVEANYFYD